MAWLLLEYKPTTLFALKSSYATSTVARNLIVPTPYVIKMAFVNAAFRAGRDESFCSELVERLSRLETRIKPAQDSVVTQTIQKIRVIKEDKGKKDPSVVRNDNGSSIRYQSTVAYREVVWVSDEWTWAFDVAEDINLKHDLIELAPSVNYVGKRGSLVQFMRWSETDTLDAGFTIAIEKAGITGLSSRSHIAPLDDFGPQATLAVLNSFDPNAKAVKDKHRVIRPTIVPSELANSGYGFYHYHSESKDQ